MHGEATTDQEQMRLIEKFGLRDDPVRLLFTATSPPSLYTFFVYISAMETIPLGELNHHPSRVTARVRAGATIVVTEHGRPVICMTPVMEPSSGMERLIAAGQVRQTAHPGAMPELLEDLGGLPSLADLLIAERDKERDQ